MDPLLYKPLYLHLAMLLSMVVAALPYPDDGRLLSARRQERNVVWVIAIIFIFWIGMRPIHPTFIDSWGYAAGYYTAMSGHYEIGNNKVFEGIMQWFAQTGFSVHLWLTFVEAVYIGFTAWAVCRLFTRWPMTAFAVMLASFSFFSYGTNGLRNGMACSIFLMMMVLVRDRHWVWAALLALAALGIHKSLFLPIGALILAYFYRNTRAYALGWLACIALSLVAGDYFIDIMSTQGLIDTGRNSEYLSGENVDMSGFSRTGFRYDFLLYGCVPIVVGCYFVLRKKYDDATYKLILNVYIICNAVWVLVNRSWLSNRIAYLSWFLYGFVLMYPLLMSPYLRHRRWWVACAVMGNAAFSYVMWLIGKYV